MLAKDEMEALIKPVFEEDKQGKPVPMFEIKSGRGPGKAIIAAKHSLLIEPNLKAIDLAISRLFESLGRTAVEKGDSDTVMRQADELESFARKLRSQAYYLDTSDRNSWMTIEQVFKFKNNSSQVMGNNHKALVDLFFGKIPNGAPAVEPDSLAP